MKIKTDTKNYCYLTQISPLESRDVQIINECRVLERPNEFDVKRFLEHKEAPGPNANCFAACVFEKAGVVESKWFKYNDKF